MRQPIFAILSVSLLVIPLRVAADFECQATESEIQDAIREIHTKQSNVGLAAIIIRGDKPVFAEYLGLADVEFDVDVDSNTRFGLASITKLYTAVALLQLLADGHLDLADTIQKHLPDFPPKPEGDITLEMLALHKSGIPHPRSVRTPELFATHFDNATDAVAIFADEDLLFKPGTDARYSSSNYNLIAAVIEQVAGRNFKDVVATNIFDALRLTETRFDNVLLPMPSRARRYSYYHPWTYAESDELFVVPSWDYSFNTGGGNIIATATDVARFAAALSRPGLLRQQELDLLHSQEWFGDVDDSGRRILYVSGANPGVQAGLAIIPEPRIVAVVVSNTWGRGSRSGEMTRLALEIARLCDSTS